MKSVRLHAPGDLQIHNENVPVAGRGEGIICIKAVGIYGPDLHWFSESGIGDARLKQPLVLGYEFAQRRKTGNAWRLTPQYLREL
jgi:L-iditol 2-dehydrogenase